MLAMWAAQADQAVCTTVWHNDCTHASIHTHTHSLTGTYTHSLTLRLTTTLALSFSEIHHWIDNTIKLRSDLRHSMLDML